MTRVPVIHFVPKVALYISLLQLTGNWKSDNMATIMNRKILNVEGKVKVQAQI
jgi:hypothetical protein